MVVTDVSFIPLQIMDHINTAVENGRHRSPDPSNEGDPAFRSQLQSFELWNQEFGFGLFKEIGKSESVYGHFY
jgi:hypothetical protein